MSEPSTFEEPWQAELFALTVALSEGGLFGWPEWTERFGAVLKAHGAGRELDGGADYFAAWLEALERLLADRGAASADEAARMRAAWEAAFLATPHGQPVRIAG